MRIRLIRKGRRLELRDDIHVLQRRVEQPGAIAPRLRLGGAAQQQQRLRLPLGFGEQRLVVLNQRPRLGRFAFGHRQRRPAEQNLREQLAIALRRGHRIAHQIG